MAGSLLSFLQPRAEQASGAELRKSDHYRTIANYMNNKSNMKGSSHLTNHKRKKRKFFLSFIAKTTVYLIVITTTCQAVITVCTR